MNKISNLERYGEFGWRWQIEWDRGDFTTTIYYRTNMEGDGLYAMVENEGAYSQSKGNMQWGLPEDEETTKTRISEYFGIAWV